MVVILLLGLGAGFAGVLRLPDPIRIEMAHKFAPPLTKGHVLGADELGRNDGASVAVVGCGTSWFVAQAYAVLREAAGHGETDAFRKAGRQRSYRDTIMVTTLAPCWYCSGLARQFHIGTVVAGDVKRRVGVPPPKPAWGLMLADGKKGLMAGYWWLTVLPGCCIMLMVLSANPLGDWLRVKLPVGEEYAAVRRLAPHCVLRNSMICCLSICMVALLLGGRPPAPAAVQSSQGGPGTAPQWEDLKKK